MRVITPRMFYSAVAVALLLAAMTIGLFAYQAEAARTYRVQTHEEHQYEYHNFFGSGTTATTTTATSTNTSDGSGMVDITGAKKVTMFFTRGGATSPNTGATRFEVEVSPNGSDWYDFSHMLLTDASETATSSVTISAATSTIMAGVDLDNQAFAFIRCIVIETTDGEHTCRASVEF